MSRAIYLSNSANQDFQAIIMPYGEWEWSEIWSSPASSAWGSLNSLKLTEDFYKWYKNASSGEWSCEWAKVISMFFDNYATKVSAGESKELLNISKPNEYFNAKLWDTFKSGSSWWLFLRSKDGKWVSAFSSDDNHSWITQGKNQGYEVLRAQPGKVWHADEKAGNYAFAQVKTNLISPLGTNL